jgi:type II secretory pathway component PulJ
MNARGSTLLETLVALAITALIVSALASAVLRTANARERATRSADRLASERSALFGITAALEAARRADDAPAFAVDPPADAASPWSALRLLASGPTDDVRRIGYRVASGVLVRRESARLAPADATPPEVSLLDGVTLFRVRCFDGTTWTPTWTSAELPQAVEVTLAVDDGDALSATVVLPAGRRS